MTKTPQIADRAPKAVEVEAGKTYSWCACGKSAKQPFCDGSHKGSEFTPMKYTAEKTGTAYFCMCKHSGTQPLCDGSHSKV
ncbi:MAG: CDGSH iron-sulfur domain-containing protein [Proteobacteria bacterium]|nr:CDGSH iron-sulfur domain-containing protein [Pseudomonadota bacterium]